ncbi:MULTISPECIES: leucyl aminopeptidase [Mesorhizobium]|uniref:Probable cytosol aminopeptidase n=1 Tax=Mesorhizobium denitrificans TaxID=2294114 RepID=A0A371XIN8_9HYPH|nr:MULTISPECIES: leucyl aminopeptidase [Mesorhizobium]RFC69090.1 leucyl aminopeptidase [Mesorhizobium denitrificans]
MTAKPTITFTKLSAPKKGSVILLLADDLALSPTGLLCDPAGQLARSFPISGFKGSFGAASELLAPESASLDRLTALGVGKADTLNEYSWLRLGGAAAAAFRGRGDVAIIAELSGRAVEPAQAAAIGAGILLRSYRFDKYKTRNNEDEDSSAGGGLRVTIACADPAAAKRAFANIQNVVEGVWLARDLVNEPANTLGPIEFAAAAKALESFGLTVDVLTEREMKKLGMGALLGVAQGSSRPPRVVVMRWNGGKPKEQPVALIGKGVVFDTGGNSMKTASGMEDMKGDMGGAAAVIGAMRAIAGRKAKANVVGIIGIVENMVDGNAQRPGDIVKSMSGQTIEVLNTDAEGRLVLADVLWYCQQRFQPRLMIDLATLTGAIMVSLGQFHAGLFSNDDELSQQLIAAGLSTHERLWRMPLGDDYDKLINSKNADMKNIGGRYGGAVSAAQFLQRFVKDTPWAHLDIAGTAMSAPASEINQSWGTGFGVRLLDRFVRDNCEGA